MKQPIHILYLPGFNTKLDPFRLRFLKWWRFKNVTIELVPMKWDSGTFEQKIARIDRAIDGAKGRRIVIIGESAAGSMAVHMYARRSDELFKAMSLCGKVSHPETVEESYYQYSPAFRTSMDYLNDSINQLSDEQKRRFVSIIPFYDGVVPVGSAVLPGSRRIQLWSFGHLTTNILAMTIYSPIIIRAARRK